MCWITKEEKYAVAKTAERDIPIYKILINEKGNYTSPFQHFIYELGKEYSLDKLAIKTDKKSYNYTIKGVSSIDDVFEINEGFHCYAEDCIDLDESYTFQNTFPGPPIHPATNDDCYKTCFTLRTSLMLKFKQESVFCSLRDFDDKKPVICKGYIPEGTSYYINENGEIVTTKYVITNEIEIRNEGMIAYIEINPTENVPESN